MTASGPLRGAAPSLPRDLPDVVGLGVRRPPEGPPEEVRVGVGGVPLRPPRALARVPGAETVAARAAYPFALPPPPSVAPRSLVDLRATVARLRTAGLAELAALQASAPEAAAQVAPLLGDAQRMAAALEGLLRLGEVVDSVRRASVAEPR